MAIVVPKAFLSLAGEDAAFVEHVFSYLPHGQAFFFKQSFANGQLMLNEMEREVPNCQLFVLFASKISVKKTWVNFELDKARLAQINGSGKRLQIVAADAEVTAADLPPWMRDFWFERKPRNARDVARLITLTLNEIMGARPGERMHGRGALQDDIGRRFNRGRRELGGNRNPNIIIASGVEQIGRETLLRNTLPQLYYGVPQIANGPVIELPVWADIVDIYRALRGQVEEGLTLERFDKDLDAFRSLDGPGQIAELVRSMMHFEQLGEAVILRAPSFLYDRLGRLHSWVRDWFIALREHPKLILGIVVNRQIGEEDLVGMSHICQFPVGALHQDDIRVLIDELSSELGLAPPYLQPELMAQIGGHPVLARAYVRLIEQYGGHVYKRSPDKLYKIQDGILQDNIDPGRLSDIQRRVLHVLSWVPRLDAQMLERVCIASADEQAQYGVDVNDLILGCLVEAKDSNFSISGPVRSIFRRKFGYGPDELLNRMADTLDQAMNDADASGTVKTDLVDAIIFMIVLTGRAMPPQFRRLLMPSTLETLVRDAYNAGREDEASYDLVIRWGSIADEIKMDDRVREQILSSVVRAHVRKEEFDEADVILKRFDERDYRSRFFLRGFRLMKARRPRLAIPHLVDAGGERRYRGSAINQLGIAYFQTGQKGKLRELLNSNGTEVERSAFLLDLRIQLDTAENNFGAAMTDIQRLARLPEDDGRSIIRRAIVLAKQDKNYTGAVELISQMLEGKKARRHSLRFIRGILAAKAADRALAISDAEYLRANARRSGEAQYHKIVARLAVAERNWKAAIDALDHLQEEQNIAHQYVLADALRLKIEDMSLPLSERNEASKKLQTLTTRPNTDSDLDFAAEE